MTRGSKVGEGSWMAFVKVVPAVGLLDGDGGGCSVVDFRVETGGEGS